MDKNNIMIPVAIMVAGALIAGGIYFGGKKTGASPTGTTKNVEVRKADSQDHLKGNPKAEVVIIEYSDLECPYCKYFHEAMNQVMSQYGENGKVAWVYRTYWAPRKMPNGQIFHPSGGNAAEASECVAELGGNDKFWSFIDKVFQDQENIFESESTSLTKLTDTAVTLGIDKTKFDACMASDKYLKKIADEYAEGNEIGVSGTPNSFILSKGKFVSQIPGAVPFDQLKAGIDAIINN